MSVQNCYDPSVSRIPDDGHAIRAGRGSKGHIDDHEKIERIRDELAHCGWTHNDVDVLDQFSRDLDEGTNSWSSHVDIRSPFWVISKPEVMHWVWTQLRPDKLDCHRV